MGGISIWQLLIVFGIVVLVFGTKKLRNMGGDVGGAIRNFKQAMNTDDSDKESEEKRGCGCAPGAQRDGFRERRRNRTQT